MTPSDFRRRWEGYLPPELRDTFVLELAFLLTLEQNTARSCVDRPPSRLHEPVDKAGLTSMVHAA
jgi:hypothetical protein